MCIRDSPYDGCITEEIGVNNEKYLGKLETMVTQHFGGVREVHYGLCENGEIAIYHDF